MVNAGVPSDASQPDDVIVKALLILLPVCAAAGPYLMPVNVGVGELYAFRLLALLGFPVTFLIGVRSAPDAEMATVPLLLAGVVWIVWGVASLLWTPGPRAGVIEVVSVVLGALAASVIIRGVAGRSSRLRLVALGFGAAFVMVLSVSSWEIATGHHLTSSYVTAIGADDRRLFVTATFGNPNALGAFLLMAQALFYWQFLESPGRRGQATWLAGIVVAPVLMLVGGCRTALVGAIVCAVIFSWAFGSRLQRLWFVVLSALTGVLSGWVFFKLTGLGLDDLVATWRLGGEFEYGGSAGLRLNLIRNGWDMIKGTWGMGVGAGGFVHEIEHGYGVFDTGGIVNPHSFWLEIGTQYGVLVLLGVVMVLLWWLVLLSAGLKASRLQGNRSSRALAATGLTALAAYVIGASSNSTFIPSPVNWAFLGTVGAIVSTVVLRRGVPNPGGADGPGG
jgi:teichuronic acid biosynthesis protein TuaE